MTTAQNLYDLIHEVSILAHEIDKTVIGHVALTPARYYVLHHTFEEPGLSLTRLAFRTFNDKASVSRNVYGMERDGLLERHISQSDRRVHSLFLTDKGRGIYLKAKERYREDLASRFEALQPQQKDDLIASLHDLSTALQGHLARIKNLC